MVSEGDQAPDFEAPLANGDVDSFRLADRLDEAPLVLAFFPGAFTSVCTDEMGTFRDRYKYFKKAGAEVYGVSVDLPFSLNEFRDQLDLGFGLISDDEREIIDQYGISMDFEDMGVYNLAKRSVFIIDEEGTVVYSWVSDDPDVEPEYGEILTTVQDLAD